MVSLSKTTLTTRRRTPTSSSLGSRVGATLESTITTKAKPACQRFGMFYDGRPNALALQIGHDGHLPHLNITARHRSKHTATDQSFATVAGKVVGIFFCVQFFSGELKAQRLAQDRIPEFHGGPISEGTVLNLTNKMLFGHGVGQFRLVQLSSALSAIW